jgi:hypothetical protein
MAVVSAKERHQSRRSSYRSGSLTHTREWLVATDDINDGTVLAMTAVPQPGQHHPVDFGAIVTSIEAQPHDNSDKLFLVQIEYTTTTFGMPASPLNAKPDISYGSSDATEAYFQDHTTPDRKRCCNSAGDPFESFPERETGELTITITVNEETFNPVTMDGFRHTLNQEPVSIDGVTYAAGTLKLSPPTAQKVTDTIEGEGGGSQTFVYYRVTYLLKAKADGWDDKILDVGTNELIKDPAKPTDPGKLRPIVDSVNSPVKKPWPLAQGRKKPSPDAQADELVFKPYKSVTWASLKPFKPETWAA